MMVGDADDVISMEVLAAKGAEVDAAVFQQRIDAVTNGRHLHLHLHLGNDRAAEGLRHQPWQLPRDARHGQQTSVIEEEDSLTSTSRSPTPSPC